MSTIKVDNIDSKDSTGNITFNRPIVADVSNVTGTIPLAALGNVTHPASTLDSPVITGVLSVLDGSTVLYNCTN